jgi:two-component system CheB/CheR fusion protein
MSTEETDQEFEALLEYLRANRGFDFTGYKRATLRRRVNKRLSDVDISGYSAYQDYLEVHPDELSSSSTPSSST